VALGTTPPFGGGTTIDAVLCYKDFMRALFLHSLSMCFDAEPEFIDGLIEDDDIDADASANDGDEEVENVSVHSAWRWA
jgi:hypothetical protein